MNYIAELRKCSDPSQVAKPQILMTCLRENLFSQNRHAYGLMPSCALLCLLNSSDLLNFHSHPGQLQAYGFSPVCRLKEKVSSMPSRRWITWYVPSNDCFWCSSCRILEKYRHDFVEGWAVSVCACRFGRLWWTGCCSRCFWRLDRRLGRFLLRYRWCLFLFAALAER